MSILLIGDPHFKVDNGRETSLMSLKICEYAAKIKPRIIVVLGDILDRHEKIHVAPLGRSILFLSQLVKIAPLFVVIGNHDRPNNSAFLTDDHPFVSLKLWNNTFVIDKPYVHQLDDLKILLVPYVPPGRFQEAINTINTDLKSIDLIFAHQEFKNAKMGAIKSVIGDPWSLENPMIFSGHIHEYDELQSNIIYTGTPMQTCFGDTSEKTVSVIDIKSDRKWSHRRFNLGLPRKRIYRVNYNDFDTFTITESKDDTIKVVISGPTSSHKSIMNSIKVKTWISQGIKVCYKTTSESTVSNIPDIITVKFSQLLYNFCKDNNDLMIAYKHALQSN